MKTKVSSIVKKTKPVAGYIRRIAKGDFQLFISTGLALPVHHSDHYSRLDAQQTAHGLNASMITEVR